MFRPLEIPALGDLPLVGEAIFGQPIPTYAALLAVPVTWWLLYRTH